MCGRFAQDASEKELEHLYNAQHIIPFEPNYNIAPQTNIPVVLFSLKSNNREIHLFRWGLIAPWAKDDKRPMINARSETVQELASFKSSFKNRRCIVPATGFYEWHREGKNKTPYFIKPKEGIFSFAAIWSSWTPKTHAAPINTVAILTIGANPALQAIHHRVPVHLREDYFEQWLNPKIEGKSLKDILQPLPDNGIKFWEVDKRVNKAANNDPRVMEPKSSNSNMA